MSVPLFEGQGDRSVPVELRRAMWALIGQYLRENNDPLGVGLIYNQLGFTGAVAAQTWAAVNDARYTRALGRGTISKLRIHVAVQSGNISLAVYSPAGAGLSAFPGLRKATTGAVACPGTGAQDLAIGPVLVEPGDFLAMSCDNTTASFLAVGGTGASSLFAGQLYAEATAHPLPAVSNPTANNQKQPMILGVP